MDEKLAAFLNELEVFGIENDSHTSDRTRLMLNVTPDTGEFLHLLAKTLKAQRILEIGTSNGYSTLWLADAAAASGGRVTTVEILPEKAALARENFARAGLSEWIEQVVGDAAQILAGQPANCYDFIFLDANRGQYTGFWEDVQRILIPGGLIVVDNAISHAPELRDFSHHVRQTPGYLTAVISVGKGELLILKEAL